MLGGIMFRTYLSNGTMLSTVLIEGTAKRPAFFESCWFFNLDDDLPDSEVVAYYDNKEDALEGHIDLVTKAMPDYDFGDMFELMRECN